MFPQDLASAILKHNLPEDVVSLPINANKLNSDIFVPSQLLLLAKIIPFLGSSLICCFLSGQCDLHLQLLPVCRPFTRLSPTGAGQEAYLVFHD